MKIDYITRLHHLLLDNKMGTIEQYDFGTYKGGAAVRVRTDIRLNNNLSEYREQFKGYKWVYYVGSCYYQHAPEIEYLTFIIKG